MSQKLSVLILYDYFYPGHKAGGPIQSLTNLAIVLADKYEISVITTAYDLTSNRAYKEVKVNNWNKIVLPGSKKAISIYYSDRKTLIKERLQQLIKETAADIIYLNGIFSFTFFLLPLQLLKNNGQNLKIVVCPRGMLQQGALRVKPFKKKLYLLYLRLTGVLAKVYWHATNAEEAKDIQKHFPKNKGIVIAYNIPKIPFQHILPVPKRQGELKLVFLSLVAEKKNLLQLIQLIQTTEKNIVLDIYGPIIDEPYWHQCEQFIKQMPEKVRYKGEVEPANVQEVLAQYHALILLTKGENFGHAIYESLSVGRPVITSYFTPWNDLQKKQAGENVDISNREDCLQKLHSIADLDQEEYNLYCKGAHRLAVTYYENLDAEARYAELFGKEMSQTDQQ